MSAAIESIIHGAILRVATNLHAAELDALDPEVDFREQLDLDSLDFLNILIAIEHATGVAVPEADYGRVRSLAGLTAYVAAAGEAR